MRGEYVGVAVGEHRAEHRWVRVGGLVLAAEYRRGDDLQAAVLADQPLLVDEQCVRRRGNEPRDLPP